MTFWSDETWRALSDSEAPVEPFNRDYLQEAKYVMAVGSEVYLSSSTQGATVQKLSDEASFSIAPGQFAYIITQEIVRIPKNAIGFISINARIKFSGLVNISGFHVDPGYRARIVFSVFNAGPAPIPLRSGDRIFPLWIASLDQSTKNPERNGYMKIESDIVRLIAGNHTTAHEINDTLRKLRTEYDATKLEVSELKATKIQLLIFFGVIGFFLGGMITAGSKMTIDWILSGRSEVRSAISVSNTQTTSQPAANQAQTSTSVSSPMPSRLPPLPTPSP